MEVGGRLERLERRLAAVEREVRELRRDLAAAAGAEGDPEIAPPGGRGPPGSPPTEPPREEAPRPRPSREPQGRPASRRPSGTEAPPAGGAASGAGGVRGRDLETWLGRNALLVVGLLALVAAAGFLLKHAFEQGWISPGLRVGAGLVGGIALAAWGERLQGRGTAAFGSALVGGGGAIAYLALWGAAGPYALVPPALGVLGLGALSALVVTSGVRARTPLLASLAAAGAFLAPALLPRAAGSGDILVLYAASVGVATGWVAARLSWRGTFAIAVLGYFLVPAIRGGGPPGDVLHVAWLALGGAAALAVCRRRGWGWLRGTTFVLAWSLLAMATRDLGAGAAWLLLALLPLLGLAPLVRLLRAERDGGAVPTREWAYLALSAGAWAGVSRLAAPPPLEEAWPLALFVVVAAPYVLAARARGPAGLHAVGFALLTWGVAEQLAGVGRTAGFAALALASGALTRPASLAPARWTGFAIAALAGARLLSTDEALRAAEAAPFAGDWALVAYLCIAAFVLLARPLWGSPPKGDGADRVHGLRPALWVGAGVLALAVGTEEILFAFDRPGAPGGPLVRDLTVSAFWLAYAGALIGWGLAADSRPVRVAGLAMTGLAVAKVAFYDLTRLEALYRVGSFCLLAVIALLAAYAYHRRGEEEGEAPPGAAAEEAGDRVASGSGRGSGGR